MLKIGIHAHPTPHQDARYILLYKNQVLVESEERFLLPFTGVEPGSNMHAVYCGEWRLPNDVKQDVFVCRFESRPKGFQEIGLRELLCLQDAASYLLLSRAHQLSTWEQNHQFCSRCGSTMHTKHATEH